MNEIALRYYRGDSNNDSDGDDDVLLYCDASFFVVVLPLFFDVRAINVGIKILL